jgi:hypothetical protein
MKKFCFREVSETVKSFFKEQREKDPTTKVVGFFADASDFYDHQSCFLFMIGMLTARHAIQSREVRTTAPVYSPAFCASIIKPADCISDVGTVFAIFGKNSRI